jgi:hypothetical protein
VQHRSALRTGQPGGDVDQVAADGGAAGAPATNDRPHDTDRQQDANDATISERHTSPGDIG